MPSSYSQQSFAGGMDMFSERTRLDPSRYPLLVNGRSRFGRVRPVKKPKKLTEGLPSNASANYQGLYAAGPFALVFANGLCYARNFASSGSFYQVPDFSMSPGAAQVWMELVPASTINYKRILNTDVTGVVGNVTLLSDLIAPSPVAAVIQDGETQPWVILSNGQARKTQNYGQWQNTIDAREYVPIGKQMVYTDGKLYITDGKQIFQSVSGRPLDFIVAIDMEGNKISLDEATGGAANTSHRVFYDDITCLGKLSSNVSGFYVGSPRNSFIVIPDFTNTIYNEPTFSNKYITNTGSLNQFSFLGDVNGDSTFVNGSGIRSFNSIMQERNEGKNTPFSLMIQRLFSDGNDNNIEQTVTAAGQFNNYSCYAVQTIYGSVVVWYDELRKCWEAIDIYEEFAFGIRQFAEVLTDTGARILLALTNDGSVYKMFASEETAPCTMYFGDWTTGDPTIEQVLGTLKVIVSEAEEDGTVLAYLFVDDKLQNTQPLPREVIGNFVPGSITILPFGSSTSSAIDNLLFDFSVVAKSGWKFGVMISMDFLANITHVSTYAQDVTTTNVMQRQQQEFLTNKRVLGITK